MSRRAKNGNIRHVERQVSTGRPMHLTTHLRGDRPSMRTAAARAVFLSLLAEATRRGLKTVAYAIVGNHIHWIVRAESAAALTDATRYVFGMLARRLNKLWGRRGKVFAERFYSTTGKSVTQAFAMLGYVLRNPYDAGCAEARRGIDPFIGVNEALLGEDRFLRTVFGPPGLALRRRLRQMTRAKLSYVPLSQRQPPIPQLALPGL